MLHLGFLATDDAAADAPPAPYHLSPSRLTTHGVVLGMTGSGKTGLCIDLLEEAALTGVPILAIDPKGDLANLARPWPASEDARWRQGLAGSGVDADRIQELRDRVRVTIHTPGSSAGVPIDVLGALAPPPGASDEDLAEASTTAASAVLGLAGVKADPVRDPRSVVLSTLIREAWRAGESLDAETLVLRLVDPPFAKVGVFPVDTFLARSDRLELAMSLNAVLAAPGFEAWRDGEPIDVDAWLRPSDGPTPVRVFYLAHLDEAARSFFLTLLLSRVLSWTRRQPGAESLRALLFFDEVYGYLPPHPHDPPTKRPLLTLLKQARAVGLGVVVCTQNPVDLDYKALSNTGWWAVGRLSTSQDRDRVLDGMVGQGDARAALEAAIGSLQPRVFAVRDVRDDRTLRVASRWAISWLGGPRTLSELRAERPAAALPGSAPPPASPSPDESSLPEPPVLAADLPVRWWQPGERFGPVFRPMFGDGEARRSDGLEVYAPALLADVRMVFDERGGFHHEVRAQRLFYPLAPDAEGRVVQLDAIGAERPSGARYRPLPAAVDEARELQSFQKRVRAELLSGETTVLFTHAATKLQSRGGEAREAFERRVAEAVQDRIDARVAKLREKVEKEVDRLEAKRDKLERDQQRHAADAQAKLATEVVSAGETLFGMLFGGRSRSLSAAVGRRQSTSKAQTRAADAERDLRDLEREVYEAELALQQDIAAIEEEERASVGDVEEEVVRLESADVEVAWTMLWVPVSKPL